jgi:hypothetical protein
MHNAANNKEKEHRFNSISRAIWIRKYDSLGCGRFAKILSSFGSLPALSL